MVPAFDGGDDFVGIGGPHEGFGVIVGFLLEAVDGGLEIDNRAEGAAFEAAFGQFGEEALGRIEPRGGGRGVMEDKSGVSVEPGANPRFREGRLVWGFRCQGLLLRQSRP